MTRAPDISDVMPDPRVKALRHALHAAGWLPPPKSWGTDGLAEILAAVDAYEWRYWTCNVCWERESRPASDLTAHPSDTNPR